MKTWVYIDHFKGEAVAASWEAIGAAKALGGDVTAVLLGAGAEALANAAFEYGADEVVLGDDSALADFRVENYATALSALVSNATPNLLLFPTTSRGRELAGMVAIDLNTGVLVDVVAMELDGEKVVATRPIYAGKLLEKTVCNASPQIVTLRGRAFAKPEATAGATGTITKVDVNAGDEKSTVEGYAEAGGGVSLTDAGVIVSGGRGVSNNPNLTAPDGMSDEEAEVWRAQQGFALITDLASTLGAAVGASRAAVDANYIPYANQVGQTGKVVSPDLYIANGISGAIQHIAGMRNSKVIVAINKDADAPIFKSARYGVVGDLFEIVPALNEAMKAKLGK
ncbi:MAG: electron transfer flavoprotein subunit alpha/FixB family protein [Anaerolineae bacterium]|jgi:electron transfer flavoprotein alpha subunit|nr:electron transfer flavoprotein subunit alpha/FixB family protein [Anaerolineae bacterium]MBT7069315.1 electron transfer flavoprotein subunit alpha/FixB family protein [Anaerolineae bacterium]MBT7325969.1 electron transfer flavoprotein subunit alpha/FixB family protein [Anaerolineae bacterium]